MNLPALRTTLLLLLAAAAVAFALPWLLSSDSAWAVGLRWLLIGIAAAVLLVRALPRLGMPGGVFERVHAVSAMITGAAIFVAAGMFFFQRHDQARLTSQLEAAVIRPVAGDGPVSFVLLTARVSVENKGLRKVFVRCMAIDVLTPVTGKPLSRSASAREELNLEPVAERIAYENSETRKCTRAEERRKRLASGSVRPVFMWGVLELEPSETDDRHFEIPVSCRHPFARVIFKMRNEPGDELSQETKTLVSLWDACRGETGSTSTGAAPTVQAEKGAAPAKAST